ncbi:hypothetical protein GCM10023081_44330 [Arthrobacter ginkgonis]|uniref:Uncharacterized protein n=1 Tax=Arthrobacter ginkgonis TaxID=1630594 RepID=A0ABP7DFU5_9MICC
MTITARERVLAERVSDLPEALLDCVPGVLPRDCMDPFSQTARTAPYRFNRGRTGGCAAGYLGSGSPCRVHPATGHQATRQNGCFCGSR